MGANLISPFVCWTIRAILTLAALLFWGVFFGAMGIILTAVRRAFAGL